MEYKMKKIGIVFPGQGSQKVGMGKDLFNYSETTCDKVQQAQDILNIPLATICIDGPQETLTLTENAQPGLFLISAILFDLLRDHQIYPSIIAGHSLGELSAYYASGSLSFEDTLTLIKERGLAMAQATKPNTTGMAAVLGKSVEEVNQYTTPYQDAPVVIANINCPGQTVISGKKKALNEVIAQIKADGGKVIPLPVSGAFHSPLMSPAKNHLLKTVELLSFSNANYPIILNRTAQPETHHDALKANIPEQVISSVQWTESIQYMTTQCDIIIECGYGKVLTGLIKKIDREFPTISVSDIDSLNMAVSQLKTPSTT